MISKNSLSPLNRIHHAFAAGFGFGIMSSLVSFISPLAESVSPGILSCESCPRVDVTFIAGK